MLEYTKMLIALRKSDFNCMLNRDYCMLDRAHIGYPDLSYHSTEAWKADLATYNRHLGIMHACFNETTGDIKLYFVAYNFYWKQITFSLPYLPPSVKWDMLFATGDVKEKEKEAEDTKQGMKYELESRSCAIFKVSFNKSVLNSK